MVIPARNAKPSLGSPFLTAEWRYLAMLNYEIDPAILTPFVPKGTELDSWNGKTFVSVVGFLFLNTRVMGLAIPFHRNFEEINLRFYVRRKAPEGWRRGVVFIKEIVPRTAIALIAHWLYNENYVALPTGNEILRSPDGFAHIESAKYYWTFRNRAQFIELAPQGEPVLIAEGSEEEFIAQHYWGYSVQKNGGTVEYRVEHPTWRIWKQRSCRLECDVEEFYGKPFAQALGAAPSSAFLAEGSEVTVYRGKRIEQLFMSTFEDLPIKGWVLYDGTCGFCSRWVPFWENTLKKRGFRIAPLQADWVSVRFALTEQELASDFRLLLANGDKLAGADVYRYLMRRIWWATPLYFLSLLPVLRQLFDGGYRAFADNRHRISRACRLHADHAPGVKSETAK
jgi:uncharacterized protein YqjF (DUF2071 family)/predicted DCC family thiol-disulfide oxidoreductase YuxK